MSHATIMETHLIEQQGIRAIPVSKTRLWAGRALIGALLWTGLYLRDRRVRGLIQPTRDHI